MCGVATKDRRTGEELRKLVKVEHIVMVIKSSMMQNYRHIPSSKRH